MNEHNFSSKLMHQMHHVMVAIHEKQKITHGGAELLRGQARLLRTIEKNDGISQQELAEIINIKAGSLSEIIVKLEQKGHVERKVNPKDKRKYVIFITESGREVAQSIREVRNAVSEEVFSLLSSSEQKHLSSLLQKLLSGLEEPE